MDDKTEQSMTDDLRLAARTIALVAEQPLTAEPEPAARQFQGRDGVWRNFVDERHLQNTVEDGSWPLRNLYTQEAIDNLRAQLAEAQKDAERWRRAAQCARLDQFGGFVITPDEPAFASEVSLAFTREIDVAIDAAKGESNG